MEVYVLRLGHRPERDRRISTHVALTARALGAKGIYFDREDSSVFESVRDVVERWGGDFFIEAVSWKKLLREFDGLKVHLTMYGRPLPEKIEDIKRARRVLIVVGAEKVPPEVYEMCDMNVSIGTQPHSEVAALAVFLDRVIGKTFEIEFPDGKIRVIPSEREKIVETRD
ncbi:tRNA (cytidine(56)-2'-O)-methyltransferase [Archaeoglobus neptunius]|uniref:tRNA (cytidine(56)-2'-O)-methyltransferase n=1 Tax=Archaeoglobus neptunius TaxID=2798580 RepID=UPI001929428B|nr:tRNA (cytidine(56)-2'-O)-methyltransferase [Archaeoglobus neptunius]